MPSLHFFYFIFIFISSVVIVVFCFVFCFKSFICLTFSGGNSKPSVLLIMTHSTAMTTSVKKIILVDDAIVLNTPPLRDYPMIEIFLLLLRLFLLLICSAPFAAVALASAVVMASFCTYEWSLPAPLAIIFCFCSCQV